MTKELLSGNEAIARGAYEYGVLVAAAYPGTPSTEILENISHYQEISSQWSPNEKVALEVACGASIGGARTLAAMKHVGVNVAADPLLTLSYTGVNGGLVLVSADDPGVHSSQNEQDNRFYGRFAKVPVFEPSDSQEAKDFVGVALDVSEQFDTAAILRTTTRISHSKSLVELGEPKARELRPYTKDIRKNLMIPALVRLRQPAVFERVVKLAEWAETAPLNRIEWNDRTLGVITSGISYQYVKEACPEASVLKLGMTFPLPANLIREFAAGVEKVVVVEELEPYLEEAVRLLGVKVIGTGLSRGGELTQGMVARALDTVLGRVPRVPDAPVPAEAPGRPPVLCPGCPHRAVFHVLGKLKLIVSGDIGCYTLGALPPLNAMDFFMCMGASVGMALGLEKANPAYARRSVAVIGDSTFLHSGMTGLLDMLYNGGTGTVVILDNSTTAMTGHQDHPATGKRLDGRQTYKADLEAICRGLGVRRVTVVDPFEVKLLEKTIREEVAAEEVSVVIARRPCALLSKPTAAVELDEDICRGCKLCLKPGCPAMRWNGEKPEVNEALCSGCELCATICPFDAIGKAEETHA